MKIKDIVPGKKVKCVHSVDSNFIGKLAEIVSYSSNGTITVRWLDGSKNNTIFNFPSSFELVSEEKIPSKQVNPSNLKEGDRVELLIPCFYKEGTEDALVKATLLNVPKPKNEVVFILDEYIYDGDTCPGNIYDQYDSIQDSYKKHCLLPGNKCNNVWTVLYEDINVSGNSEYDVSHLYITKLLNNEKKKENTGKIMSNDKLDFTEILAQDASKAAVRSGATLGINGLKAGLKKLLVHEGIDGLGNEAIMNFFEGPIGEAMLRASLGYGLMYLPIPMIQENEYAQKLSEELRVSGMAKGMDKGAEIVQQFILPSLLESFQGTPLLENFLPAKETKHRVSEHVAIPKRVASEEIDQSKIDSEKDQELDEDLDDVKAPKAKQSKVIKS